jgi:hypothetical protein
MKKMLCFIAFASILWSCKKDPPPAPVASPGVTLVSTAPPTKTVAPPKDSVVFGPYNLTVTDLPGFTLNQLIISFTGATDLSGLKNLRFTILDGTTEKFTSLTQPTIGPVNQPWNFYPAFPLPTNHTYTIIIMADAVDANMRASIGVKLEVIYSWQGGTMLSTGVKTGPTVSFVTASVISSVSGSTPASTNVVANQKVETLAFTLTSLGQPATVTGIDVTVPDATAVQTAELYSGPNLLGTAPFTGNTAKITGNAPLQQDTMQTYSVKLVLKPVTSEAQSSVNIKTAVTKVTYRTPNGQVKVNDTVRVGNSMYSYKSLPTVRRNSLTSVIDTTQQISLIQYEIDAAPQGAIGTKQVAFDILLSDITGNGASNDTLSIDSLALYNGTSVITNGIFTNAAGQPITSLTESDTKLFFTVTSGNHEIIIPAGTTAKFTLKGRPHGFKHPNDGDLIRTALAADLSPVPVGYRYVNRGTTGAYAKLYSSAPSNSGAVLAHFLWSDLSAVAHSAAFTASTPDYYSGYSIAIPTSAQVISQ